MTDVLDRAERLDVDDLDDHPVATLPLSLGARTGRWRTAARLARREMRRRPWRTALSMLLIAVPVAAMVVADVAYRSDRLPPDLDMRFGTADARLYVGSDLDEQRAEIEAQFPDGTDWTWSPYAYVPLRSVANPDELVDATVVTRDMDDPLNVGTVRDLSGRYPATPSEAVLDRELADDFGVGIGDELTFVRPAQTFSVVGLADIGGDVGYPAVLAPGFDLSVLRPTVISYEVLVTHPSLAAEAAAISDGVPIPPVEPFPQIEVRFDDPALGDNGVSTIGFELRGGYAPEPEPGVLFLGWLFGVLLMGVLGLVVAAAFAVSGRRQLVTIGQLSATGADPVLLRRFLALQGTWTGIAGAGLGVAGGLGIARAFAEPIRNDGRIAWSPTDWTIIAATAVVVATVAAIVPTRSMAGMSVLSALGGRRPVRPVPRRQLPIGIASMGGGLVVIFLATVAARNANDTGGDFVVPGVAASLAGMAVITGVCCLCPLLVDVIARVGTGRRGVPMLAARSLGRHRARAAALLAAIVAVGAVGTTAAALGEQAIRDERAIENDIVRWAPDVVLVRATTTDQVDFVSELADPDAAAPALRDEIETIVGPVRWASASTVGTDLRMSDVYVADDALLDLMGLTPTQRSNLAGLDSFVLVPDTTADSWASYASLLGPSIRLPEPDQIVIPGLAFNYFTTFVSPAYVASAGLEPQAPVLFGRAERAPTESEADAVQALGAYDREAQVFAGLGVPDTFLEVHAECRCWTVDWATWVRLGTLGGTLLLMTLIITLGMALWAAEGRDERDTLVAVGASPSVLARIAGTKAWALAFVGMLVAVPLGFGTLRLAVAAAHQPATFPWVFVVVALVGLPLLIGVGAWVASATGQRARPVTASTMSD